MKRRQFLGAGAALTFTLSQSRLLHALDSDNKYRNDIGIQLYTLRNQIKANVGRTIEAVAKAGYKQVEPYGFPNADEMIQAAKDNGLAVNSTHFEWDSVVNPDKKGVPPFAEILEKANKHGLTHLVIPWLPNDKRDSLDKYKTLAEQCNAAAQEAAKAGVTLAYHNHAFEFQPMDDGVSGFDIMMKEFDAAKFEVDTFWVQVGGHDPAELVRKLKGRVTQLHLKDLDDSIKTPMYDGLPQTAFKELGNGVIDIEPLIDAAADAGVAHCHVEQDHSPNPMKSIRQSMKHLKSL
ncbi:MAG: sugar phosphate isomerase/epimerase [Planctomycetota bacterium]